MIRDTTQVLQWIDARRRMLDFIEPKVTDDEEMALLISRSRQWDSMMRKMVLAASPRPQADEQASGQ